MKKLVFFVAAMTMMSFASCEMCCNSERVSGDSISADSTTIDSAMIDSIVVDTAYQTVVDTFYIQ